MSARVDRAISVLNYYEPIGWFYRINVVQMVAESWYPERLLIIEQLFAGTDYRPQHYAGRKIFLGFAAKQFDDSAFTQKYQRCLIATWRSALID